MPRFVRPAFMDAGASGRYSRVRIGPGTRDGFLSAHVTLRTAAYSVGSSWSGGFVANVTVTAGSAALTGWKVTLTLPAGTSITGLWNGQSSGTSGTVTVTDAGYNGALGAGASTSFGFQGAGSGSGVTVTCAAA